jgi:hypothetical protein
LNNEKGVFILKSLKKISIFLVAGLLMLSSFSFVGVKSVQAADTDQVQYTVGTTKNISSAIAQTGKDLNAYEQ